MRDAIIGRGPLSAWLDAGGQSTLASYGGTPEKIPPDHLRFLCATTPFHETETEIFVHACLEPDVSLVNQTSDYLRWKHLGGRERPHVSGKRVVCGHTAQADGRPLLFDGWVCIDTAACSGGWLTCLDAGTNLVTQASQGGRIRAFPLTS